MPTRLSMALCVGIVALAGLAGYAARLPVLSGDRVGAQIDRFARRHRVNLRVQTYEPLGLSGLRFKDVSLRARRGDYLLEADLREVDVRISLKALFSRAEIHPGEVEVHGGDIRVLRQPAPKPRPAKPASSADAPTPSQTDKSSAAPKSGAASKSSAAPPLLAILHDVRVRVDLAPLPAMQNPLWVQRADFLLAPQQSTPIEFRHAYGQMPDGMPFAVKVLAEAENPAKTYQLRPRDPTRIDRWFDISLPFGVSAESISICPQCSPALVGLHEVEFAAGSTWRAQSELLALSAGQNEVRLNLATVSAQRGEAGAPLPYQLANFELQYDALAQTSIVQGELEDGQDGVASFGANWSAPWGVLSSHILLQEFRATPLWEILGWEDRIQQGTHSGEVELSYEPALDLLEFSLQVDSRDLRVSLPLVSGDPLSFEQLDLQLEALFQPMARTLSVSRGEARLQGAGPVRLDGYAVDAGAGLIFDLSLAADTLDPQRLRDALPPSLSKLARGSNFEGAFGFQIDVAGHTRFPDEIVLSVGFEGDVEVLGDSRSADVLALAGGGPPSFDLPGTLVDTVELKDWIDYEALPERVPLVLAAAEDAKFFKHEGFDWVGLRAALAFNIEEGALKRGGSTLSQQLSKNVFLDRERTLARKLQEAYVTWRLEDALSKQRIMELYINLVEWGPNIQGLRAAAGRYFKVRAEDLSVAQTALLGAILPGPSLYGGKVLAGYLPSSRLEKIKHILSNLRFMKIITPLEYTQIYGRAKDGQVGGLSLTICADDANAAPGTPKCW